MTGPGNPGMGVRQPNPQMSQDHGPINTVASMATGSQLTGGIQSKPGMGGDMAATQATVGGALSRVSQGGGVNVQMSAGQVTNPGMSNPGMSTNSGMGNPNMNTNVMANMGGAGMDPAQGLPVSSQMNPQMSGVPLGVSPGQAAPGASSALPDPSGSNQLNNRTVIWKGMSEHVSCTMRKCTFGHVHPRKTQISMCICAVWSESLLSAETASLAIENALSEDSR